MKSGLRPRSVNLLKLTGQRAAGAAVRGPWAAPLPAGAVGRGPCSVTSWPLIAGLGPCPAGGRYQRPERGPWAVNPCM